VIVLTLAVGIGANVAIFSLFQQILLRPLPVAEPEQLVNLSSAGPKFDPEDGRGWLAPSASGGADTVFSYLMFRDLERGQEPFVGIAAHRIFDAGLSVGGQPRPDIGMLVSGSYFSLLGLRPTLGRLLGPQDDRVDGQADSVVLSQAHWLTAFGGDPGVIGRRLIVNGTPLTIVGVAPPGFHGTTVGARASVFVPITLHVVIPQTGEQGAAYRPHANRGAHWVHLFARLKPGVTREEAVAAINPLYRAILNEIEAPLEETNKDARELEAFRTKSLDLEPGAHGQSALLVPARDRLGMLSAVSGIVLLLCCANVGGLMLVRGSARTGEMVVRASMGATRGRLTSLLVTESLLLALPAALLSLPVALLTLRGIARTGISPAAFDVDLSPGAALVAIGVAVVSALAFGLFPVRNLMRTEPRKTLQAYGARQTSGKGVTRFRTALATAQIALSMGLLAVSFVFAQSLANIARIDLGLEVDSVVTFSIAPETSGYAPEASARLYDRLEEQLAAIRGVSSAASSRFPLLAGGTPVISDLVVAGVEVEELVPLNYVSPGFFRTLGIESFAGRDFRDTDAANTPKVAIVNQRFTERFGLRGDVTGPHLRLGTRGEIVEIVGLVANAKYGEVTGEIEPQLFLPRRLSPPIMLASASFYVRGARLPEDLMNAVRETVARVDPIVPITDLRTMRQQVRENIATERFVAGTSTAFAVLATVLAGLGLYGVLAYSVAQRSREIGLRVALGAPANRIRGMVLRQVAAMALIGVVLGAAAAWLLSRAARALLFGVEAGDPVTLVGAAVVLAAVTLGAAYLPARRASRIDPIVVLRYE